MSAVPTTWASVSNVFLTPVDVSCTADVFPWRQHSLIMRDTGAHRQNCETHLGNLRHKVQDTIWACNSTCGCSSQPKDPHFASQPINTLSSAEHSRSSQFEDHPHQQDITTVMVRNIPFSYTVSELQDEINGLGFLDLYDFLYMPIQKKKKKSPQGVGYAFINFLSAEAAGKFQAKMHKYRFKLHRGSGFLRAANVSAAHFQGLDANVTRLQQQDDMDAGLSLMVSL